MDYLKAFLVGGAICMLGQILIDKTRLTPARILVCYVVLGVILGGAGVYDKLVDFAGAGATVPLTGFGNTLAKGVREAVKEQGILGALTGGLKASAAGIAAAVVFGFLAALLCNPKYKSLKSVQAIPAAAPQSTFFRRLIMSKQNKTNKTESQNTSNQTQNQDSKNCK